jgi:hypothetical protein
MPRSDGLDAFQICDDTYSISCLVAAVKVKQISAGKLGAGKAELMAAGGKLFAVFYGTSKTRIRLVAVPSPTSGARLVISNVCTAQAAIHATRRNDHRVPDLNFHNFVWHTVLLVSGANAAKCRPTVRC